MSSPSKISKFVQAERLLYKEMDVIRILNEIKELRQTNSEMMEAYEMMFQNANNYGLPPKVQQEDSKLSEKLSNHNEEFPEAPVGPASGKENSINDAKDIITKRTPPRNNSTPSDFKSLIHSHHDVSHHREIPPNPKPQPPSTSTPHSTPILNPKIHLFPLKHPLALKYLLNLPSTHFPHKSLLPLAQSPIQISSLEQMAVSSIYNIVDQELANLKAKEEDQ